MAKDYTDKNIETVTPLQHIRKHPGMYSIDPHTQQGQYQIFKEIIDNSIDETKVTLNKHHTIDIVFLNDGKKYQAIIHDQGRGVPLSKLKDSFGTYGTSGKNDQSYNASTGTFGVGAKATSALSTKLVAISKRKEGTAIVTIAKAVVEDSQVDKKYKTSREDHGTTVLYEPDPMFSGRDIFFDEGQGYSVVHELLEFVGVFRKNITFRIFFGKKLIPHKDLIGKPKDVLHVINNVACEQVFESNVDLTPVEYLRKRSNINSSITWQSPIFEKLKDPENDNDLFGYQIELFSTKDAGKRPAQMVSAVNGTMIKKPDSAHVAGLREVLKKHLADFISDEETREFFNSIYKLPIHAVIMVEFQNATFVGQGKDNFTDRKFKEMYTTHLDKAFKTYGVANWNIIYDLIEGDITEKYNRYTSKEMQLDGGLKNLAFKLNKPKTFHDCESTDKNITEILFTEGEGAGGYVKQHRNPVVQAVFKLGGKPINPFRKDSSVVRADKVYQDIVRVLGVSRSDTDLSNMNYNRIGILADPDNDGYHISALLLGIFWKINPLIITSGRVFIANPPLYILRASNRMSFVRDKKALQDVKVQVYEEALSVNVVSSKGKYTLAGPAFRDFVYGVTHIGNVITSISNKLIVEPLILESLTHCVDLIDRKAIDTKMLAKYLGADVCEHLVSDNAMRLTFGGLDMVIPLKDLVSEIKAYILPELDFAKWKDIELNVTTSLSDIYENQSMTVYQLYEVFLELDKIYNINKLKGLGELPALQLKQTCLDPATRCFTNITGVGDIDRIYGVLGTNTQTRKKLIQDELGAINA